jgi:hypothetical protein
MVHYFGALALLAAPALLATALSGVFLGGREPHLTIGLFTAVTAVATHSLMILFMIVTGRVIKAAMASRTLDPAYLGELNRFFEKKPAYPAALLAAFAIVATGVLGYAQRGFGLPPAVHMLVGIGAVVLNLWALAVEYRALRDNQSLLDRTAKELDRLDAEGARDVVLEDPNAALRFSPSVRWLLAAGVAWGPVAYWGVVVWKGSFERISPAFLWGSGFASAFCLLSAWLTRGESANSEPG